MYHVSGLLIMLFNGYPLKITGFSSSLCIHIVDSSSIHINLLDTHIALSKFVS